MMKISLRHPSGLEIEFEGDEKAFGRFAEFLSQDVGEFVRGLSPANIDNSEVPPLALPEASTETAYDSGTAETNGGGGNPLNPRVVAAHIERVEAKTDIDRVTVIAQAAVDAGLPGIDYATIEQLYTDMGLEKPMRFAKAFSNAKARGLVRSVKHGTWAPTVQGENYARFGTKPPKRPKRPAGPLVAVRSHVRQLDETIGGTTGE
jgi:hypothetical protein